VATINDGGNKELGVVLGCENSKILLYTFKGKLVKKIDHHKGPITAVQLTSQDVLVTGTYKKWNVLSRYDFRSPYTRSEQNGIE